MKRFLSIFILVLLLSALIYSTYSFSQGRFMEGMLVFPALIGCYFLVMAWQKRQDDED